MRQRTKGGFPGDGRNGSARSERDRCQRRILHDRDAKDRFPTSPGAASGTAARNGNGLEPLVLAFQQHIAAPPQVSCDEIGGKPVNDEPRHLQFQRCTSAQKTAVRGLAMDCRCGPAFQLYVRLVDEPEPSQNGGKVDDRSPPRIGPKVPDGIAEKREGRSGKTLDAHSAGIFFGSRVIEATLRRIAGSNPPA